MPSNDNWTWGFIFTMFALLIMGGIGWVMNIVAVCTSNFDTITGMLVCRCIGILIAPLGAVLGWL
jgi:hypothetical protein